MSVLQPPLYMAGTYPPALLRAYQLLGFQQDPSATVLRAMGGVIPRGGDLDMPVTASASTVTVGAGAAVVPGTENSAQYGYLIINDAPVAFTIPAAPASQTRRDLIVARVRDSAYSGANTDADLVLVQGTPASSSPTLPAVPANAVVLAQVSTAGTGAPVATAAFGYTCAPGGIRPSRGGSADDLLLPQYAGQYRDLSGELQRGSAAGGTWIPVSSSAAWTEITASLRYSGGGGGAVTVGTGGIAKCRYQVTGKSARLRYHFRFGTSPNGGSDSIYTALPAGMVLHGTGVQKLAGTLRTAPSGDFTTAQDWPVFALCDPASPNVYLLAPSKQEWSAMDLLRASGGSPAQSVPLIPSGSPIVAGSQLDLSGVVELV